MKWTNSYRSFGLKTKRSTGLKTIEHKHEALDALGYRQSESESDALNGSLIPSGDDGSDTGEAEAALEEDAKLRETPEEGSAEADEAGDAGETGEVVQAE